jgi:hypothetical protein
VAVTESDETAQAPRSGCREIPDWHVTPEEARVSEETTAADGTAVVKDATVVDGGLDQPEDEATEHALRLMDEALRRNDAGRRWLVAGDP